MCYQSTAEASDIPYKPLSYESTEYGTISQKGIIEVVKDNFKAKSPEHIGSARELEFNEVILKQLDAKYIVDLNLEVETDETDETDTGNIQDRDTNVYSSSFNHEYNPSGS